MQSHAEKLVGNLSDKLMDIETKLFNKIESEIKQIQERANEIEDRIASIESEMSIIDKLSKEVELLKTQLDDAKENEKKNNSQWDTSTDAVIFGIPFVVGENLKSVVNQVCHSIDFLPPQIRDIFRITPKTSLDKNTIVIIKFYTPFDRNRVLKAFSDYRKKIKSSVNLRSIGFDWDSTFRIYESLSPENRKLLQSAHKVRRAGKLWSVFSVRGKVFVRRLKNTDAIYIAGERELSDII